MAFPATIRRKLDEKRSRVEDERGELRRVRILDNEALSLDMRTCLIFAEIRPCNAHISVDHQLKWSVTAGQLVLALKFPFHSSRLREASPVCGAAMATPFQRWPFIGCQLCLHGGHCLVVEQDGRDLSIAHAHLQAVEHLLVLKVSLAMQELMFRMCVF